VDTVDQHFPVWTVLAAMQFDKNNVPFLSFPSPYESFILTPPRASDADTVADVSIAAMNDPRVYLNLSNTPFPYVRKDWDEWNEMISKEAEDTLAELKEVEEARQRGDDAGKKWVSASPFRIIRQVDAETGEEKFIGEIMIWRQKFGVISDEAERKRLRERNNALPAGDPGIGWAIACKLSEIFSS
jgi:hypothetical protein